ncbi:hypothetical protein HL42_1735 [Trichophyton rubrum]|nr:hypothetical protein HL42_1735 [Trichophyton rubrum]
MVHPWPHEEKDIRSQRPPFSTGQRRWLVARVNSSRRALVNSMFKPGAKQAISQYCHKFEVEEEKIAIYGCLHNYYLERGSQLFFNLKNSTLDEINISLLPSIAVYGELKPHQDPEFSGCEMSK